MEATRVLPFELWREIALSDPDLWYSLTRVVRGLYSPEDREKAKGLTVSREKKEGVTYTEYRLDGQLHRDGGDGPAVFGSNGSFGYYRRGKLHREDGPAMFNSTLHRTEYRVDGRLHRDSTQGPARTHADGTMEFYEMGELHRDPGPAVMWGDGRFDYYVRGVRHRPASEGPAALLPDGSFEYWEEGEYIYCTPS